jgi:hypothetical protein
MKLGDKVKFQKELVRKNYSYTGGLLSMREVKNLSETGNLSSDFNRYYERNNKKILEGIVCGKRTIKYKGYSNYIGYEEGYGFETIECKSVYLIACNLKEFHKVPEEFLILEDVNNG